MGQTWANMTTKDLILALFGLFFVLSMPTTMRLRTRGNVAISIPHRLAAIFLRVLSAFLAISAAKLEFLHFAI